MNDKMHIWKRNEGCPSHRQKCKIIYWGIALAILLVLLGPRLLLAQTVWLPERSIPEYNDRFPPLLIADKQGIVHAFNSEVVNDIGDTAVFYRQWTRIDGWSSPVDILLPPEPGVIRVQDVFLDGNDTIHMVFFAGTPPDSGAIYYTHAALAQAGEVRGWARPVIIGERAGPLAEAALVGDVNGRLIVLYAGRSDDTGLYEVHSTDFGLSWSKPAIVFLWQARNQQPANVWLALDDEGQIHAVWAVTNDRALGEKIFYARLPASLDGWSPPILLAERTGSEYSANWPSIIFYNDELFVFYMDSTPPTRYMRRSADGGRTWSDPVRPFTQIGEYEQAVFLVDSSDTLHLVLGNRYADPEIHGMWHSIWDGQRWSRPAPIVSGPVTSEFDPSAPRAVISQGNVMLVTWWHNATMALYPGYSFAFLDAPALEAASPAIPATVAVDPISVADLSPETIAPLPEATATAVPADFLHSPTEIADPGNMLFLSVIPTVLIILMAALFTIIVSHRR